MSRGIHVAIVKTPIGPLTISEGPDGLVGVDFDVSLPELAIRLERRIGRCTLATGMFPSAGAILAYFEHRNFLGLESLKVAPMGTPFQRQVWAALRTIPPGTTISYGELAARLGRPTAVRAVGAANGDNPVSIVVPCHRVIGQDGSLVGYGGGIDRKRWLLTHEGAIPV